MKLLKSKAGFTLIELLVVIGILAVLAAIAIPSVAGLIDRANVSADKTNANEMTNAVERFAAEYELYCQDVASGVIDANTTDFDAAQGRVYNVTGALSRSDIEILEVAQGATVADNQIAIYRDTKYPVNAETMKKVVENYTKTSSSTFEPKQSDMHYWYSPDCGVVVFAEPNADQDKENKLNGQIQSGKDAKGNDLGPTTQWIDLTLGVALSGGDSASLPEKGKTLEQYTWEEVRDIVAAGKAGEYGFAVGSTKTLQINGATKTATIIGLNHDGNNTATFMIMSSGGIGPHVMNTDYTNAGGWEDSEMREWLNKDIYNSMSNKDCIKEVPKMTNNTGYQGTTATSTSDKVFLLSLKEAGVIAGLSGCPEEYKRVLETEGTTYTWFETNTVGGSFWFRSPDSNNDGCFYCCFAGDLYDGGAGSADTVRPAFVIG